MERIPNITGPVKVYLGDDVRLSGHCSISGGRVFSDPEFRVGNRSFIGAGCIFSVAKSITIGDDVLIASGCIVSDYSAHPLDPEKRIAGICSPGANRKQSLARQRRHDTSWCRDWRRCGSWRGHSCNQGCSSRAYLCGEPRQAAHANCL
jgi:hypothetical protein